MKKPWQAGQAAFERFKAYAQNTRRFDQDRVLASEPFGDWLLYAANPVFIEITQGGTSSIRGFGAIIWLIGALAAFLCGLWLIFLGYKFENITALILGPISILISIVPAILLYTNFVLPTDLVVRFDRPRQLAYMWTYQGPIVIPWANLTPVVQGMATSTMFASRVYRGLYIEYGPDSEPRRTHGVPHIIHVGQMIGTEKGALHFLEYIRRYMTLGLSAVPCPRHILRHRPGWRAMFNLANCMDEWAIEIKDPGPLPPWGMTCLLALLFPLLFPMQVTHWLALRVAPLPHWPKELQAMHAADLAALGLPLQAGWQAPPPRTPIIRLNGVIQAPAPDQRIAAVSRRRELGERLAAGAAIALAWTSTILFWGGANMCLPFTLSLEQIFVWPSLIGLVATAIAMLSLPSMPAYLGARIKAWLQRKS